MAVPDLDRQGKDDVIYRQDAIDALDIAPFEDYVDYKKTVEIIKSVPSAQTAQRKGKWLLERGTYYGGYPRFTYHCSECGFTEEHVYSDSKCSNFCPHCGADMRQKGNAND